MKKTYKKLKLDCLVILGGNGTHKTAYLLVKEGLNIVSLPKTIDNDLWGTDVTFGFHSAVNIAGNVIDCIHTTAISHGRVFIIELMGHKAGWLTLYAGIASGADVILIPEIPYSVDIVAKAIEKRTRQGKNFSIIVMAEGAVPKKYADMSKKERKGLFSKRTYPTAAYELSESLQNLTGQEVRVTIPGHFQRGGPPCPYDRILATQFGTIAAELIFNQNYGNMSCLDGSKISYVPISDIAGKLKSVSTDCDMIKSAEDIGTSFGNN